MPVRRRLFSASPRSPVTERDRLLQRNLDFGERRNRHAERHRVVENAVLAKVGVGEHVIADFLALPQARAMSDHQPAMRPQHGDMVGDVLGVGGADADVDEADPLPVGMGEVVSGHLETVPDDAVDKPFGLLGRMARFDHHVAGQHQTARAVARAQLFEPPAHELIDIAVIVGQQHPRLHRAPVGAGVMDEPAQRIVYASRVEQRERSLGAESDLVLPVGNLVADRRERSRGKMQRELGGGHAAAAELVAALEHVGVSDLSRAVADLDFGAEFVDQRAQLLEQVVAKIPGLGHRRRINPGSSELGEGAGTSQAARLRSDRSP